MSDLSLIFVPQWSPFQPALSLPSLSAWLKRATFDVTSVDANILFYEWLFSDDCAELLQERAESSPAGIAARAAFHALFANVAVFRDDLHRLREPRQHGEDAQAYAA